MAEIWTLFEHRDNKLRDISGQLVTAARGIAQGDAVVAYVLVGKAADAAAVIERAKQTGADSVVVVENAALTHYTPDAYAAVLTPLIKEKQPLAFLCGHTSVGWDLSAKLAVQTGAGLASNLKKIERQGSSLVTERICFYDKL